MNVLAVGLVISAVSVTVSGYKLQSAPRTVRTHPSYQQRIHNHQNAEIAIGFGGCSYNRGTVLMNSLDDYGPQFASYLQNDVSVYTVGEIIPYY